MDKNTISAIPHYIFSFLEALLVGLWLKIEYKKIKVVVVVYTHIREQVLGSCKPKFVFLEHGNSVLSPWELKKSRIKKKNEKISIISIKTIEKPDRQKCQF